DQSSTQSAVGSTTPIDILAPATPNSNALQQAILFGHGVSEGSVTVSHSIKQNGPGTFTAQCPPEGVPPTDAPTQTPTCALFSECTNGTSECFSSPPDFSAGETLSAAADGREPIAPIG